MLDMERVVVRLLRQGTWRDATAEISSITPTSKGFEVTFALNEKSYTYGLDKIMVFTDPRPVPLSNVVRVAIDGATWSSLTHAVAFAHRGDPLRWGGAEWIRAFWTSGGNTKSALLESHRVEKVVDVRSQSGRAEDVFTYWKQFTRALSSAGAALDPTTKAFETFDLVDDRSALAAYLRGETGRADWQEKPIILPYASNLDQREAVERALRNRMSVIHGPPGTGKTQTILNLLTNILLDPAATAGVVSFGNSAVENVLEKLTEDGLDIVAARLGDRSHVGSFIQSQDARNERINLELRHQAATERAKPPTAPGTLGFGAIADSERALQHIWKTSRELAVAREHVSGYELELSHFRRRAQAAHLPDLTDLPLLRKSSDRIMSYLVEHTVHPVPERGFARWSRRVRDYFQYGRQRGLDTDDVSTILRIEEAFYTRRLEELRARMEQLEGTLAESDHEAAIAHHRALSRRELDRALKARYATHPRPRFRDEKDLVTRSRELLADYPVVLSTCHSLRRNIAEGRLLDWLIIDEATQVSLPIAALAMSRARNVVVVGDLRQLGHIVDRSVAARVLPPPAPHYDVVEHSILSSMLSLYADAVPSTLLREHFRCPPAIIGFCNKMFYDDELIPCTTDPADHEGGPVMFVHKTAPGNHMRRLCGSRINPRESEVILEEVLSSIQQECQEQLTQSVSAIEALRLRPGEFGIATPYRGQADHLSGALTDIGTDVADTIHRFQGRGIPVMILSTVLDETRDGQIGISFVDDPRMINVAVSRATKALVVVINDSELPRSRYLRSLVDYIRYQDPESLTESGIISIFDLLYREYSARLRNLAARVEGPSNFRSENITWTVLGDVLASDSRFSELEVICQQRVIELLPDVVRLDDAQRKFVQHARTSVDFTVFHRVSRRLVLTVEVDGFSFHAQRPEQLARDAMKDQILNLYGIPILRLGTTGSREPERIRSALEAALADD